MALPVVLDQTPLQLVVRGSVNEVEDCENVLYGQYTVGGTPTPGGLTLDVLTANFLTAWATFWADFMADDVASIDQATLRIINSFTGLGGNKFKVVATDQWTVVNVVLGTVTGQPLDAFSAFGFEKRTTAAGRGRQGHLRLWGVPESMAVGNRLDPGSRTTIQTAVDAHAGHGTEWLVGAVGKTDQIQLRVVNGPLINANPGHIPVFYMQLIEQLVLRSPISSQLTRKLGRRRRKLH